MSQAPHQPNFKTNVNRAKTKRWVEAKSYSYDGDDWGDADEYDEYGGYDEPTPPPPKPTGLRQRGQSATQSAQHPTPQPPPSQSGGRHGYNNIGGQPATLPPQGMRSATNPQPRVNTSLGRSSSFERGDETRAFSAGGYQQGLPQHGIDVRDAAITSQPPQHKSFPQNNDTGFALESPEQMQVDQPQPSQSSFAPQQSSQVPPRADSKQSQDGARTYSLGGAPRGPPPAQHRPSTGGNRTQSMTSENSAQSFFSQRKLEPMIDTPPLQAEGPPIQPGPAPAGASQPYRPPRKSSLSQQTQSLPSYQATDSMIAPIEQPTAAPWERERSGSSAGKPLPFVRPADIYLRMQEEKERERQSQDSSRPSMDAINREYDADKSSPMRTRREGSLPRLQPVTERAIETELRGNTAETVPSDVPTATLPTAGSGQGGARWDGLLPQVPDTSQPMLPDLTRMSRFDSSFLNFGDEETQPEEGKSSATPSRTEETSPITTTPKEAVDSSSQDTGLKHQSSAGVRSIVNQAFDQAPATPSSGTGSSVDRSISGSTATRSPPVSRGSSSATDNIASRINNQRTLTPPPKIMDTVPEERRMSSSSEGTPKAERPPSGGPLKGSPKTIIPGYRRDMSTPSPDNSPARTPAIEQITRLQSPQEAELAIATPVSPALPAGANIPSTQVTQQAASSLAPSQPITTASQHEPRPSNLNKATPSTSRSSSPTKLLANSVREREESPSSNRVKDIAGKFGSASRKASDQSPAEKTKLNATSPSQRDPEPYLVHPPTDRAESFRPQLPGGWDSYGPSAATGKRSSIIKEGPHPLATASDQQSSARLSDHNAVAQLQGQKSEGSKEESLVSPTQDPFAALSAAGSALAGAFSAATGAMQQADDENHKKDLSIDKGPGLQKNALTDGPKSPSNEATPRQAPPQLTSLDTERKPQYESDRLRREIEKSLSANKTSEPTTADTESSWQISPGFTSEPKMQRSGTGLESPTLPSEYDSYWNEGSSVGSSRSNSRQRRTRSLKNEPEQLTSHSVELPTPLHLRNDQRAKLEQSLDKTDFEEERPALTPQRYSWERPDSIQTSAVTTSTTGDRISESREVIVGPDLTSNSKQSDFSNEPIVGPRKDSIRLVDPPDGASNPVMSGPIASAEAQATKSSMHPLTFGATTPEQESNTKPYPPENGPGNKGDTTVSSQAPTAPEPKSTEDLPPLPVGIMTQPRIPGFREILALKTPQERIEAFNDARKQYATAETGLPHWLMAKNNEIGYAAPVQNVIHGAALSMQQSSATPGNNMNLQLGTAFHPGGRSHGSSPVSTAGAKLNRQQLQSKGKDLLKDANVLSGKANVAAKGLFMKGRNKLRGADKASSLSQSPGATGAIQPPSAAASNAPPSPSPQTSAPLPSQHLPQSPFTVQNDSRTPTHSTPTKRRSQAPLSSESMQDWSPSVASEQATHHARESQTNVISPISFQSAKREPSPADGSHEVLYGDRGQLSLETGRPDEHVLPGQEPPQGTTQEDNVEPPSAVPVPFSAVSDKAPSFHLPKITPSRFSTWEINTPHTPRPGTKDGSQGENLQSPVGTTPVKNHDLEVEDHTGSPEIPHVREDLLDPTDPDPIQKHKPSVELSTTSGGLAPPLRLPLATGEGSMPQRWANIEDAQPSPMSPDFQVREPSEHSPISEDQPEQPPSPVSPQRSIIREAPGQHRPPGPIYFGPSHDFDVAHDTQQSAQHPIRHSRSVSRLSEDLDVRDQPPFRRERSPSIGNVYQRRSGEVERTDIPVPHEPSAAIEADEQLRPSESLEAQAALKRNSRGSGFFRGLAPPSNQATPSSNHSDGLEEFPIRQNDGKDKRGKRGSLFRSLTGQNSSSSNQTSNTNLVHSIPPDQPGPSNPRNAIPDRQASDLSTKSSNKLQRSATSGIVELEKGKRKRFSKLGSIFGGRLSSQTSSSPQSQSPRPLRQDQHSGLGKASGIVAQRPGIQHEIRFSGSGPQGQGQVSMQRSPGATIPITQQDQSLHHGARLIYGDPPTQQEQRQQQSGGPMQTYSDPDQYGTSQPLPRQQQMQNESQPHANVNQKSQAYPSALKPSTAQAAQPSSQPAPSEQRPSQQFQQPSHASQSSWVRRSTASQQISNPQGSQGRDALRAASYRDSREAPVQSGEASMVPSTHSENTLQRSMPQKQQQALVSTPAEKPKPRDLPAYMEDAALRQTPDTAPLRKDSGLKKTKDRSIRSKSSLFSRTKSSDTAKTKSLSSKHQKSSSWMPSGDSITANQVQSGPLDVKDVNRLSYPLQATSQQRQAGQPPQSAAQQPAQLMRQRRAGQQQGDSQQYLQEGQMSRQPQGVPQHQQYSHQAAQGQRIPSSPEGAPPPPPPKDYWHITHPRGSPTRLNQQQLQPDPISSPLRQYAPSTQQGQQAQQAATPLSLVQEQRTLSPPPMISPLQQQQPLNFNPGQINPAPSSTQQPQAAPSPQYHDPLTPLPQQLPQPIPPSPHQYQQHRPPALPPIQTSVPPSLASPPLKSSSVLPNQPNPILGPHIPDSAPVAEEETATSTSPVRTPKSPQEREARAREIERNSLVMSASSKSNRGSRALNIKSDSNISNSRWSLDAEMSGKEVVPPEEGLEHDTRGEEDAQGEVSPERRRNDGGGEVGEEEEPIVMSPVAYPGQMWTPGGMGGWEHY